MSVCVCVCLRMHLCVHTAPVSNRLYHRCVCTKLVGPRCTKLARQTVLCEDAQSGPSCVQLVNMIYLLWYLVYLGGMVYQTGWTLVFTRCTKLAPIDCTLPRCPHVWCTVARVHVWGYGGLPNWLYPAVPMWPMWRTPWTPIITVPKWAKISPNVLITDGRQAAGRHGPTTTSFACVVSERERDGLSWNLALVLLPVFTIWSD